MKIIVPLEIRIQQKGEKYGDDELLHDAIEVHSLRLDLEENRKVILSLVLSLAVSMAILASLVVYVVGPWH